MQFMQEFYSPQSVPTAPAPMGTTSTALALRASGALTQDVSGSIDLEAGQPAAWFLGLVAVVLILYSLDSA